MYTVQFRNPWYLADFATVADAVAHGLTTNHPFDVSVASGAIVWTWEMR